MKVLNTEKASYQPRPKFSLLLALFVYHCAAVANEPQHSQSPSNCTSRLLQGSWQLQSARYQDNKGKLLAEIKQQSTLSRKLIAGQHFSFITWQPDGKFSVAASGSFYTDQRGYHEQVDAASLVQLQGKTYHFQCTLAGDHWLHQGMEDGVYITEQWQRIGTVLP